MTYREIIDTYGDLARAAAEKYHLRDTLVLAVIRQESSGRERAVSKCGARGLMQVMAGALQDYNEFHLSAVSVDALFQSAVNVDVGSWYLSRLITLFLDDVTKGLQAYNQGRGRVLKNPLAGDWYAASVLKHEANIINLKNAPVGA